MKRLFMFVLICLLFPFLLCAQTGISVSSYSIDLKPGITDKWAGVTLICRFIPQEEMKNVQFIFSSEAKISSLRWLKGKQWLKAGFRKNGKDSILVAGREKLLKGKEYTLRFIYRYPAGRLNDTLLMLDRGHRWYPLIMDRIAPFKLTCRVPSKYNVLTAGRETGVKKGAEKLIRFESGGPVFKIPAVIFNPARFAPVQGKYADAYILTADKEKFAAALKRCEPAFEYLEKTFGVRGNEKLKLIEVKDFPGVNICSGLLMCGAETMKLICSGYDDPLHLAIVQQWFGARVFARYGGKGFPFLSISLPHYIRYRYMRELKGEGEYEKLLKEAALTYGRIKGSEKEVPVIEINSPDTPEKGIALYAKGPLILSAIEKEMGSDSFGYFLKCLYDDFSGKIMSLDDFEAYLARDDDHGEILNLFRKLMNSKAAEFNL